MGQVQVNLAVENNFNSYQYKKSELMGVGKWTELVFFDTLCTECELKKSHISLTKSNFNLNFLLFVF